MGNALLISKETFAEKEYLFLDHDELDQLYRVFVQYSHAAAPGDLAGKAPLPKPPRESRTSDPGIWLCEGSHMKLLRMEQFLSFPCLAASPFAPKLFQVFKDKEEGMTFEAFTLLASSVHPRAPPSVKSSVAFRVFDFNCSSEIEEVDVVVALEIMTGLRDPWADAKKQHMRHKSESNSIRWSDADFPGRLTFRDDDVDGSLLADAARNLGRDSKINQSDIEAALQAHEEEMAKLGGKPEDEVEAIQPGMPEVEEEKPAEVPKTVPKESGGDNGDEKTAENNEAGAEAGTEVNSSDGAGEDKESEPDAEAEKRNKLIERRKKSLARAAAITPELRYAVTKMADRIFSCMDIDKSKCVSSVEFDKLLRKVPNFHGKFAFRFPK